MPALTSRLASLAFAGLVAALAVAPAPAQAQMKSQLPAQGASAGSDCTSFPCGRVESIRQTTVKQSWTPLGTPAGFDADGRAVTSFKIGPGLSNQGMVVLGAGGGATYRKSPGAYEQPRWEVTLKMDTGERRVVTVAYEPFVREGDHVRVAGNSLELVD
jgi:outer membrane lipoprotein SlyB